MNMMLDERMVKLVKSCLSIREVISLCARIRSVDNSFLDICNKQDDHSEMSKCHKTLHFISILC